MNFKEQLIEGTYECLFDMTLILSSRRRYWFEVRNL